MPSQRVDELAVAEQLGLQRVTGRLVAEFGGAYGPGVIEQYVAEVLEEMIPTATVTTYLPLLAERSVRDRVRARPVVPRPRPLPPVSSAVVASRRVP